jgi:superfamily II DNA or RNA helicase
MCASPARTALIANQAVLAVQAGRKVLLLSERLGHLESIHKTIVRLWPAGAGALPSIDYYVGGRTEAERTVAAKATVILATSQFASEALDIPALDTLILSTPMSDVEQAVGRILRPSVGKKEPIVVDIRDDRVPLFKAFGDKRDRLYEKIA